MTEYTDEQVFAEAAKRRRHTNETNWLIAAQHIANGNTTTETAMLMKISHRTIEAYIESLRHTYDAANRLHLIAILLRLGKIK